MTDTVTLLVEAIQKRLAEIEEKIAPYNALITEREELNRMLQRHRKSAGVSFPIETFWGDGTASLRWLTDGTPVVSNKAGVTQSPTNHAKAKNSIDENSAASKINRALFELLVKSKIKKAKLTKLWDALDEPVRTAFKGKYAKQSAITAIKRAGHHFGIEYAKGGHIRLLDPDELDAAIAAAKAYLMEEQPK